VPVIRVCLRSSRLPVQIPESKEIEFIPSPRFFVTVTWVEKKRGVFLTPPNLPFWRRNQGG
jgi:hypothetical protein